jgi:hypothetical protein
VAKLSVKSWGKPIQFCRIKLNCLALLCVESNLYARQCQTFTAARVGISFAAVSICFTTHECVATPVFHSGKCCCAYFLLGLCCLFSPLGVNSQLSNALVNSCFSVLLSVCSIVFGLSFLAFGCE